MQTWRTPQRVRLRHGPNQRAHLSGDGRPATTAALPCPNETKAALMPSENRVGLQDDDGPPVTPHVTTTPRARGRLASDVPAEGVTAREHGTEVGGRGSRCSQARERTDERRVRSNEMTTDDIDQQPTYRGPQHQ